MDFFYQAIKRAVGFEEPPKTVSVDVLPREKVRSGNGFSAPSVAAALMDIPLDPAPKRKSFEVRHPLDHMVAFLSHPVLEANIAAMEQCRVIRTRLRELVQTKHIRSLMITSALQGEGKTTMAVNLAYALSQLEGMKILLVDSDLRRPYISDFLKMGQPSGLDKYLLEKESFADVCWQVTPSLDVVPTGGLSEASAELLHGNRMREFLAEASAAYSLVLLDAPPLFPIVDAQVLANLVDAAVLVVRAHTTPYELARQAADLLKPKLVGSILNGAQKLSHNGYYEDYGSIGRKPKK